MKAVKNVATSGNPVDIELGKKLLCQGAVGGMGAILLAGGMGTRLGYPHPKGIYPILPGLSLFEIFARKVKEASHLAKRPLFFAIMTSPDNDAETRGFFSSRQYFGLDEKQLFFFSQGSLPMEDDEGRPLKQQAADGNGSLFLHFDQSGLLSLWEEEGIQFLNILLVDNPLADPFDPNLLGFHAKSGADVTVKCIERRSPEEKVGLLVENQGKLSVVEYSEIDPSENRARNPDTTLKHRYANLSLFCLSLPFAKSLATKSFPFHRAKKPLSTAPGSPLAWKKERFIFDLLPFAENPKLLVYPRETCFAPLKNREGPDSPETVRAAFIAARGDGSRDSRHS